MSDSYNCNITDNVDNSHPVIPTHDECIMLLAKAGCSEDVIEHCKTVAILALDIAKARNGVDAGLVESGALLHDLGRCQTHGIDHAVVGAQIARKLNLDDRLVRIIERHIGAGITMDLARSSGLEEKNYVPESMEEKIVAHADNLIVGTGMISLGERIGRMEKQGIDMDSIQRVIKLANEITGDK